MISEGMFVFCLRWTLEHNSRFKASKLFYNLNVVGKKIWHRAFCFDLMSVQMKEDDGLPFYLFSTPGLILNCQGCNSFNYMLGDTLKCTHACTIQKLPSPGIDQSAPWPGASQIHHGHGDPDPD